MNKYHVKVTCANMTTYYLQDVISNNEEEIRNFYKQRGEIASKIELIQHDINDNGNNNITICTHNGAY